LVIQYNKRDLPQAMPLGVMRGALNTRGTPDYETCAANGEGVLDAMKAMIRLVIKDLRARKVVPEPKGPLAEKPSAPPQPTVSLEDHIQQHLSRVAEVPKTAPLLGPIAALAPAVLVDQAKVAEAAFSAGDFAGSLRACLEAVKRGLSFAGEGPLGAQAFVLGLNGRDLLELQSRAARGSARVDDAAFGLYVLSQVLVRLTHAGLPNPSQ
jgi:hypothetical protein